MIELLCIDVDGTLTDGSLVYGYISNSSLTQSLRELEKFSFDRRLALSQSNFSAQPTNLAQDTRIANDSKKDSSLRGESIDSPKQSKNSPSLAEGDKGGGLKAQKNSSAKFSNSDFTHPLTPSAREGGEITEIAKVFNVKDGLALAYWRKILNRKVAIITGKGSEILRIRASELQIPSDLIFMNIKNKGEILRKLKKDFALNSTQIACVGDDLNDISMFAEASLNFAPNDCANAFKTSAKNLPKITILNAKGGEGAVREAIELILQKEQIYEDFIDFFAKQI
ncbi:KdsC family phosphatase [Helicobacter sp. 23-1044]